MNLRIPTLRPPFAVALLAAFAAAYAGDVLSVTAVSPLRGVRLHDLKGRAGMSAVLYPRDAASPPTPQQEQLLLAGGANFPYAKPGAATPEQRGKKVYYADVALLDRAQPRPAVKPVGVLPRGLAYAAFAAVPGGMLQAGGCNEYGYTAKVTLTSLHRDKNEVSIAALPDLPRSIAFAAFAVVGNKFYVIGGTESESSTACLNTCYMLNPADPTAGWQEMAPLPEERMLAAAAVCDGLIYVMGGCSLHPDAQGKPERTYLSSVFCYDPVSDTWAKVNTEMPESLVGMGSPLPVVNDKIFVIGGDPGNFYRASLVGKAPARHPGQSKIIYSYKPSDGTWTKEGTLPEGIATFPTVTVGKSIYTVSGEILPGVRTPAIYVIKLR